MLVAVVAVVAEVVFRVDASWLSLMRLALFANLGSSEWNSGSVREKWSVLGGT